ncbi:uncharacterized protein LOC5516544 [Nematostella vectensis]|uniref:uncharacterized protein LOC5516544 n=1 Tax=Nematostella vectensis TaxID=45351 RepID=UPI00138FA47D|nr:uncharacterized protein LOC5516544 [Nematostella vectensis]
MDNNNNLPYGAMHGQSVNLLTQGTRPSQAAAFDPLAVARNVNLAGPERRSFVDPRPWVGNGGMVQSTSPLGVIAGQPVAPHVPYINTQSIVDGVSSPQPGVNNSHIVQGAVMGLQGPITRQFTPSWTLNMPSVVTPANSGVIPLPIIHQNNNRTSSEPCKSPTNRVKRKVSRDAAGGPSPKQFISEEKMAAKMHDLCISNDHTYYSSGLTPPWNPTSDNKTPKEDGSDDEGMSEGQQMFSLAPGIKEILTKENALLPQAILDQINKPCLAIIPWKPPENVLNTTGFYFGQNKTDDEKARDNENGRNEEIDTGTAGLVSGVDHVEVVGDTFDFDDMDL